jgi:peroxiredoxin Q/BCP
MSPTRHFFPGVLIAITSLLPVTCSHAAAGSLPAVGAPAPDFKLNNPEGKPVSLKDYRGKWVVLFFYPADFTPNGALEVQNFQRDLAKYEQAHAVLLGVSVNDADSHKEFIAKEKLGFLLLSDPGAQVAEQYGSTMSFHMKTLAARNTLIIDPEGKVAKVFAAVEPGAHSEQVLAALSALQHH